MTDHSLPGADLMSRLEQLLNDLRESTEQASQTTDALDSLEGRFRALYTYTLEAVSALSAVADASLIAMREADLPDTTRARIAEATRPFQGPDSAG